MCLTSVQENNPIKIKYYKKTGFPLCKFNNSAMESLFFSLVTKMKIVIRDYDFTEVWDGVMYKKLSDYPNITDWEIRNIIDFIDYENEHGRKCKVEFEVESEIDYKKENLIFLINNALNNKEKYKSLYPPKLITECTACPIRKGCVTEFVCHTAPLENAVKIFETGSLLSAVNARKMSAAELKAESRNAANDPEDYFDYVMFAWGNCQAGDRLVMERKLNRFPDEKDLSINFTPGVRFYFRYSDLINHENAVFDGVLPVKVKDEVKLDDWVYAVIIPKSEQKRFDDIIPDKLRTRVHYIENDCNDIWEWSEKVYCFIENL